MKFSGPRCGSGNPKPKRKRKPSSARRSLEYPCVSRLRQRRLLAFLQRRSGFFSTFNAFVQETSVFFSVAHLKHLVFLGQWDDAISYVHRFAPSVEMLGDVGNLFLNFLHTLKVLNCIATRTPCGALLVELEHCMLSLRKYPNSHLDGVRLNKMFLAILRSKQLRASISWYHVRYKAAEIVKDLIAKTPEFNDLLRLPNRRDRPHDILSIGSCSHRRHHIKERGRIPASDLARFYLQKKRSLPSSSQCEGTSLVSDEPCKASLSTWLVDIVDESVKAGIHRRVVRQAHPVEDPCNEGLIFEARHSQGNAGARDVQANMKSGTATLVLSFGSTGGHDASTCASQSQLRDF